MSGSGDHVDRADSARLFVAILLPAVVRQDIENATGEARRLEGLRWGATDQLHLTLRFIGETAVDRVPAIAATLASRIATESAFALDLLGAGAFPSPQRARVVWMGVRRTRALDRLHEVVEEALVTEGIRREHRPFRPHVTLARVSRGPTPIGLGRAIEELGFEASIDVAAVSLMRSELSQTGARHFEIRSCPLAAETTES